MDGLFLIAQARGMAPQRYKIKLTAAERLDLERPPKTDQTSARKFAIARALLPSDASAAGPGWKVADVADARGEQILNVAFLYIHLL
jgi:hypothetical protein